MTRDIELALSKGKVKGAKKLLEEYYLKEDKNQWLADKQAEYDTLFKTKEVVVDAIQDEEGNIVKESYSYLDYVDECISFDDWLNETKVISEAVEATYDEDGLQLTACEPEVTELVRPYVANDVTDKVNAYIGSKYAELRRAEYPSIYDFADAYVKGDEAGMQDYVDKCLAVKEKYPKV
jgi:hypothetical protein